MAKNVLGNELEICSDDPVTGFYRNGCCDTGPEDRGVHTVCVLLTKEFLDFSKRVGNDLSTPIPEYNFRGLKSGERWCLCLSRWIEAYNAGMAPQIYLAGTHISVLEHIEMEILEKFAVD
ncbi:MAG: DUF2237 domain-containing protein [Spirochaetia bacterium]|nr:DUF2237 domain-containing protein [Spirochaetia bacterium]